MDSVFVKALQRIAGQEGYDIFNDQDRFFAIVADYVGDKDSENVMCLGVAVSNDIIELLGAAYRNPRTAAKVVTAVESQLLASKKVSPETVSRFLGCFCAAYGWRAAPKKEPEKEPEKEPVEKPAKKPVREPAKEPVKRPAADTAKPKAHGKGRKWVVIAVLVALAVIFQNIPFRGTSPAPSGPASSEENTTQYANEDTNDYVDQYASDGGSNVVEEEAPTEFVTVDESVYAKDAVEQYLCAFITDANNGRYDAMYSAVESGSEMEQMQKEFIANLTATEELVSFEFNDSARIDADSYYVTATERYNLTKYEDGVQYYHITQKCTYLVRRQYDGSWKLADLAEITVLDRTEY